MLRQLLRCAFRLLVDGHALQFIQENASVRLGAAHDVAGVLCDALGAGGGLVDHPLTNASCIRRRGGELPFMLGLGGNTVPT